MLGTLNIKKRPLFWNFLYAVSTAYVSQVDVRTSFPSGPNLKEHNFC